MISYCFVFYFFQVAGEKRSNTGKSSRRPASILKMSTSFDISEKKSKFDVGPTISSPGPTLLIVVATAVKLVTRLWLSKEIISTETTNNIK